MRYAQIRSLDISNGKGVGISLFTQGCRKRCKNCHNPEQWSFNGGEIYTPETEKQILQLCEKPYIQRCSLLGGEPLENENIYALANLCKKIKNNFPHIKIWLYTGHDWEDVYKKYTSNYQNKYFSDLIDNIDILVDGEFIQEQKDITLKFKGSANQRIIDIQKTLGNHGEIILYSN